MSDRPDPLFTRVQLKGPPGQVRILVAAVATAGEIIYDAESPPDERGEVSCLVDVVTHEEASAESVGRVSVTAQAVFELDTASWPDLSHGAARDTVESAVSAAVQELPGASRARSRVVAVLPSVDPSP